MRTNNHLKPSGLVAAPWFTMSLAMIMAHLALLAAPSAQAQGKSTTDLWVAVMPSNTQNQTYANAAINEPIMVWGRAWNGTPPYSYDLDYGDGSGHLTGTGISASEAKFIGADHTYTTGGLKTVTLTVTDADQRTFSRQAVIRVILTPTHDDRINMAIEKGLIHLYKRQFQKEPLQTYWWSDYADGTYVGTNGAILLAFEENGHLATNNLEEDIYAETVQRGINWLVARSYARDISTQTDGNPDSNGNGKGVVLVDLSYAHGFALMSLIMAYPDAAAATAAIIPAGLNDAFTGKSYHTFIIDALDMLAYDQTDGPAGTAKGWWYSIDTSNSGGIDGSTHQWPNLAMLFAKERFNYQPLPWVINNSVNAYKMLQNANGAVGYSSNSYWLTAGKTGGSLVGYFLGGKLVGDPDVDKAIGYIASTWFNYVDPSWGSDGVGWFGEPYAMYAIRKGLQLQHVETLAVPGQGLRNWYNDMSAWLLGNADLLGPTLGSSFRSSNYFYGQNADGSWNTTMWPIGSLGTPSNEMETAHAILVLTKAVTVALPVAVIASIPDQSARTPGPFTLDGSASYHLDPGRSIVEWKWMLDPGPNPDWDNPTATGQFATVNPGWNTESIHNVTLRVKDNNDPPRFSTASRSIVVTFNDVAPVAVPIPFAQQPPIYSGKIGQTITLDGSDSFDPDGDPIISFAWDLNGDGVYGDAADALLDTSGNADSVTATVSFGSVYSGQIGLRVCSQPQGAPIKCSSNPAAIDIYVAPSDLTVESIGINNFSAGVSADVSAVVKNDAGSGQPFSNVLVRFYNGDPFTTGVQIGSNYFVDLAIGATATVNATVPLSPGQQAIYAFVDASNNIPEWDEANNTKAVLFDNDPPIALVKNIIVASNASCQGVVPASAFDDGSYDPDGGNLNFSANPPGPYPIGVTPVVVTVSDGVSSATGNASVTVLRGVTIRTKYPLTGRSAYRVHRGQILPCIVCLNDCAGAAVKTGVTVKVRVVGMDGGTNTVFQDVIEAVQRGAGIPGSPASDAIMQFRNGNYWRLNLSTANFSDPKTLNSSRYYQVTFSVIDNASLVVLGTTSVIVETR